MDREKDLEKYAQEITTLIKDTFPSFFFSGSNDTPTLREWYSLGIPTSFIHFALDGENLRRRFSLKDVRELVKKKFKRYSKEEARKALSTLEEERIPYLRIDKLYTVLKSVLLDIGVEDLSILNKLNKLKDLEDIKEIEKELISFEEEFFRLLEKKAPMSKKCKELAEKRLMPYKFYWKEKVINVTRNALIKRCLKETYGIPDFTIL